MAPPAPPQKTVYLGTFIHSKDLGNLEYLHNAAVFVDEHGTIVAIDKQCDQAKAEETVFPKLGWSNTQAVVRAAKPDQFFFPGFIGKFRSFRRPRELVSNSGRLIDTHIHASQYPNTGLFGKTTLMDWLETYTFPMEGSLSDPQKATTVYTQCIKRTLSYGTTTASYYATISAPSTNILADLCLSYGQRAFVGRCCMDRLSPDYYRDLSSTQGLEDTRATIAHIASIDPGHSLITPILTPRFAPSCSSEMMHGLSAIHKQTNLPIQTHISENHGEMELVKKLFPDQPNYTAVYDSHGLLTPKTILAHAIHISEEEIQLIKQRQAKISHCPVSNSSITSGTAKVRWVLNHGVDIGLGTDVSGGYSASILEAVRQALLVSRHVAMGGDDEAKLSIEEVLYLGTRGGAKVVGMEDKIGGFEVGMEWDAQLIGLGSVNNEEIGPVDIFGWESWEDRVAKWVLTVMIEIPERFGSRES